MMHYLQPSEPAPASESSLVNGDYEPSPSQQDSNALAVSITAFGLWRGSNFLEDQFCTLSQGWPCPPYQDYIQGSPSTCH